MKIKSKIINKTMNILLSGELDEHSAEYTRRVMDTLFDTEKGFQQVIIDLSELSFMDSTGVGVLIGRYKKLANKAMPIFISNPSTVAKKIFNMSGLYNIMPKIS